MVALTGYSCEDFLCRTVLKYLSLSIEEIRLKTSPEIPEGLNWWIGPAGQTLLKALDPSTPSAWVFPDLWKTLTVLSDTAV